MCVIHAYECWWHSDVLSIAFAGKSIAVFKLGPRFIDIPTTKEDIVLPL